jgi:hypothetical protein
MRESSSTKGCGELGFIVGTTPIRENGQLSSLTKVSINENHLTKGEKQE